MLRHATLCPDALYLPPEFLTSEPYDRAPQGGAAGNGGNKKGGQQNQNQKKQNNQNQKKFQDQGGVEKQQQKPKQEGGQVCNNWKKTGSCRFGDGCRFKDSHSG